MKQKQMNKTIWKEVELNEILETLTGFAFKSKLFNSEEKGLPLIRIRDLPRGFSKTFYTGDYDAKYIVSKGDFLIGMDGEFKIHEWKTDKSLLNQRVCKLIPNQEKVIPRYLLYLLSQKLKEIEDKTSFVTVKHISARQIEEIKIILPFTLEGKPDLEKQKQIVSILEKVEKLKEKRKESVEVLDEYLKAIFYDMFLEGDKKFFITDLDEVTTNLDNLRKPLSQNERIHIKGDIPYYGACGVVDYIDDFIFNEDLILVGEDGQNLISRNKDMAFIINGKSWANNHAHVLRMSKKINIEYLRFFLNTVNYSGLITGSAQPKLTKKNLSSIKIPLPPLPLQEKFASIVEYVEKLKEKQKNSKNEINDLFDVLIQKAFLGELV